MRTGILRTALAGGMLLLASCGPSRETGKNTAETKESLYTRGHQLYLTMQMEEAEHELLRAEGMDSTYRDPLVDLGSLFYDLGKKEEAPRRQEDLRKARSFLARAELLGYRDPTAFDRLCEIRTGS